MGRCISVSWGQPGVDNELQRQPELHSETLVSCVYVCLSVCMYVVYEVHSLAHRVRKYSLKLFPSASNEDLEMSPLVC